MDESEAHTEPDLPPKSEPTLSRRGFVKGAALLGAGAALGAGGAAMLRPAVGPTYGYPYEAPISIRISDDELLPVTVSDVAGHPPAVVTAEYDFFPAVVYKVAVRTLRASSLARGYNTGQYAVPVPGEPEHAILAYTGKCTHLGCTVGWAGQLGGSTDIADYDGDGNNDGRALCPCHQSQFDVYDMARNQPGGPAPRPLGVLQIFLRDVDGPQQIWARGRIDQGAYRDADREGDGAPFQLDTQNRRG